MPIISDTKQESLRYGSVISFRKRQRVLRQIVCIPLELSTSITLSLLTTMRWQRRECMGVGISETRLLKQRKVL